MSAVIAVAPAHAQTAAPGLRILQGIGTQPTRMIDAQGNVAHAWPGLGNLVAHVAQDGTMVRGLVEPSAVVVAGTTGRIQRLAFDGTVLWDYVIAGPSMYAHHDLEPMPDGNVLVIAWDYDTRADAIAAGRDPSLITSPVWLPCAILEIQQTGPTTGAVVWEWHIMDHVIQDFDAGKPNYGVVADHPELLDLNHPPVDAVAGEFNHSNGLDYDPVHDWIALSARTQNEIYLIDHSTTTAEARGHTGGRYNRGGDILYRWGNPAAYGRGTAADQQLFQQHDPRFIPPGSPGAGNLTIFNNQYLPTQSQVVEIALPLDANGHPVLDVVTGRYGPAAPVWSYTDPAFFSAITSSAERLPNGNTLICSGTQNWVFEVSPTGQMVTSHVPAATALLFQASYVDRSMWTDRTELPLGGGTVAFDHLTGAAHAGAFYMLLGSASGTAPGSPVPGGITIPLNADYLTSSMAASFNSGIFVDTIGTFDAVGGGHSSIVVPPGFIPAALVGLELDFAHLIFDSSLLASQASNTTHLTIVR